MTRHIRKVAAGSTADKSALLKPIMPSRQLTTIVVERIAQQIVSGAQGPGQRLPTEQEMMVAFGVSRTVVREAVAALKAEGLVVTRQGAGAFVAEDASRRPFRLDSTASQSLATVLDVLELRRAVEVEAAALAAARGTASAHRRVGQALNRFITAVERGEAGIAQDFAFHTSIAEATGNGQFMRFLDFLGGFIIPRQTIRIGLKKDDRSIYLASLIDEHKSICSAICERRAADAGAAMREHLTRSRERYRQLSALP